MTNLAKVILEDQGYRVTLKNADIAPIFTSVASGKADVFMDAWLPVTHADYMEQYGDRLETLGTVYEHAKLGLVVPEYVTIRSIEDLNAHKAVSYTHLDVYKRQDLHRMYNNRNSTRYS